MEQIGKKAKHASQHLSGVNIEKANKLYLKAYKQFEIWSVWTNSRDTFSLSLTTIPRPAHVLRGGPSAITVFR